MHGVQPAPNATPTSTEPANHGVEDASEPRLHFGGQRGERIVAHTAKGDLRVDDPGFDAWIIWNVWQVANPALADLIPVAPGWRVYRDADVALTGRGRTRRHAREFVTFLQSPDGARIFAR